MRGIVIPAGRLPRRYEVVDVDRRNRSAMSHVLPLLSIILVLLHINIKYSGLFGSITWLKAMRKVKVKQE